MNPRIPPTAYQERIRLDHTWRKYFLLYKTHNYQTQIPAASEPDNLSLYTRAPQNRLTSAEIWHRLSSGSRRYCAVYVLALVFGIIIFIFPAIVAYIMALFLVVFGVAGILRSVRKK